MDHPATPLEALRAAVSKAGSQVAFARICGVGQPAVWKWLQGRRLPAEHALTVERETGVSRFLLRPDIYGEAVPTALGHSIHTPAIAKQALNVACDKDAASQPGERR